MAMWADTITLIAISEPDERLDAAGFPNAPVETTTTVFCNKKSIGYREYYASQQAGFTASFKVELNACDYNGETLVEYRGKRYAVEKTYEIDDDKTELTLSDLRELAESEA